MPYENVPTENALALPVQANEYTFTIDLHGTLPDGTPRSTIDDLDMFDAESKVGNKQLLDFLDRVVVKVVLRGETLVTRKTVQETYEENGESKTRDQVIEIVDGVRGKGIPYDGLKRIFAAVGQAMKEANNAGN